MRSLARLRWAELVLSRQVARAASPGIAGLALWVCIAVRFPSYIGAPLFRDASMSQYSGWAIDHGMKLYGTVAAPDGPVIHFLHAAMQLFVGNTDEGCRRADIVLNLIGSGAYGAVLAPRIRTGLFGRGLVLFGWMCLVSAIWFAYYLTLGWEHTVQRDPYYALFGYLAFACVYASARREGGQQKRLAFAGGFLATLMLFTRHSGIAYPACAGLGLLLELPASGLRIRWGLLGAAGAVVLTLLLLLLFGNIPGFFFWYFHYPFIAHTAWGMHNFWRLLTEDYADACRASLVVLVGTVAGVATGMLPRRIIGFGFLPGLFLIAACIVGKGWPNHVVQAYAALAFAPLFLLSLVFDHEADEVEWTMIQSATSAVLLAFVAYVGATFESAIPFKRGAKFSSGEESAFTVAKFLKENTVKDDPVFLYGHEAHVLLYAERKTAIPNYVNMIFNIEAFRLRQPSDPGEEPSAKQLRAFQQLQDDIERAECPRLLQKPAVAIVLLDNSLRIWGVPSARAELDGMCPGFSALLAQDYVEHLVAGYHVFLRRTGAGGN